MSKMRRTKKNACTICISCNEPNEEGKMDVEMTCEGDEFLAAYLLENARSILEGQLSPSKISSIN